MTHFIEDPVPTFIAYRRADGSPAEVDLRTYDDLTMSRVWPLPPEPAPERAT